MTIAAALGLVREAPFVVDVLRAADELARVAADADARTVHLLTAAALDTDDELSSIAAVHALSRVFDDRADAVLSELLSHERAYLREHASWALGSRLPRLDAIGRLVAVVVGGGFSGMLAQRTLERWSWSADDHVALAAEGALATHPDAAARARLAETLGLVPGPVAGRAIRQIAADPDEALVVRLAAVSALGDRLDDPAAHKVVQTLAATMSGELADVAHLAAIDLGLVPRAGAADARSGLTIAQLFLHADIDHDLTRAGAGDNGGIATMLVRLGEALVSGSGVARVLTLSRGTPRAAAQALDPWAEGHILAPVPLLTPATSAAEAWPSRVVAERGIRRVLTTFRPVDVVHLRMADVGSVAAHTVARRMGVPVVFTLAPDPHALVHALDMTGALGRENFGRVDEREHYWFRARFVQRLAADAAHNVLFPRPNLRDELRELLGIDVGAERQRHTVVPEGIATELSDVAARDVEDRDAVPALDELEALIAGLPPERHGLPLVLSVGRLHRVKGMATIVEAWATDADLRGRCNLAIVGGDLEHPSDDEQGQLDRIAAVLADQPHASSGLVLAGHRPNDVVARWLAAARAGLGPLIGADGIYVCGSLKEEFGLAILEALAAGLAVVAPAGGGPATYVEHGVTGMLVDTGSPAEVRGGIHAALDLAGVPGRALRGAQLVRDRYTVRTMADTLANIYAAVAQRADY